MEELRQPVQKRAQRTREKLLRAAAEAFSGAGYSGATAKSIAALAGVSTGSFYQYFPDKDAALRELARVRSAALAERLEVRVVELGGAGPPVGVEGVRRAVVAIVREVLDYHRHDPGLHAVLTERRHADPLLDTLTAESERVFQAQLLQTLRGWDIGGDVEALAFVLFSMIEGAVHAHVIGEAAVSDRRLLTTLGDAVLAVAATGLRGGQREEGAA